MSVQSLGMIETVGLTAAIEAADAAIKSANIVLIGYELTKSNGVITVKFEGETSAVNTAISAGCAAVSRIGEVYSHKVVSRSDNETSDASYADDDVTLLV
ncbi:Propanediol utilization protein PduA [Vibrio aerogenes CECT 7868]|uniref:Propanediol utilization protein PduA n=1 Tax=Vibrio aerogenes CECT 7868 TaxID=1216006 RepID=A0A1M6D2A4_9VIBR|nr:BMC domain-containing protein [Vibrio aerogenes]SHI67251.1 Propanediol utilization protein PduA [Vibrio aerogenes CECT 7868]